MERGVRSDESVFNRRDPPHRRPRRARWPRDGDAQRAPVPGLARRLSAHRAARLFFVLRGLHTHHRFDVQPARQMAKVSKQIPLAAADCLAQLSAHVPRWRQDTQRLRHQTPASSTTGEQKPTSSVSTCRPTRTRCFRSRILLRSRNTSTSSYAGKQPSPQWMDMDAAIKHCTAGSAWSWASMIRGRA